MALLIVAIAAMMGYRAYQRSLLSPFSIGAVRPGMRFRDTDDDAQREMGRRYSCKAIGGEVQLCQLATDGPPGVVRLVVDRSGRVAVLQFLINDSSQRTRAMGSRQIQEWNHVHASDTGSTGSDSLVNRGRWHSTDSLWSAGLSWLRSADVPGMMMATDERRVRRIAESSPAALPRLVEDGLIDGTTLATAAAAAPVTDVAPEDAAEQASVAASSAASLPQCGPVAGPAVVAADSSGGAMEPARMAVAQEAIARAFPGTHLEAAGRRTSLVDSSGAAEEVILYPNASTVSGDLYAFAVTFPQRVREGASHASHFDAANQCRATSEILLARVDPATNAVADLQRIGVDDEALVNIVAHLDFGPTATTPARLIVEYVASYGTADWFGQVRWHELLAADTLRIVTRSPISYGKKLPSGSVDGGPLIPDEPSREDPYGLSYEPGTTLRFSTLSAGSRLPARHVTLLTGDGLLPNGWTLLSQL